MLALLNNNLKRCQRPFLFFLAVIAAVSFISKMDDIQNVEIRLSVFTYLAYTLAAGLPAYCLFLDCYGSKAIYTLRAADISSPRIYFAYLLTGLCGSLVVFLINLLAAALIPRFTLDRLLFDNAVGLLLLPALPGGAVALLFLTVILNVFTLFDAYQFTRNPYGGVFLFLFGYLFVIGSVIYMINAYPVYGREYDLSVYYIKLVSLSFIGVMLTITCAISAAEKIKYAGGE